MRKRVKIRKRKYTYVEKIITRAKVRIRRRSKLQRRFGSARGGLLNRRTKKIIFEAIKLGLPSSRCADLIGVSNHTFYMWLDYGKDTRRKKYFHFRRKVFEIKVERELSALRVIRECGQGSFIKTDTSIKSGPKGIETITKTSRMYPQWQAEAWFLERRYKKTYGKDIIYDSGTPDEQAHKIKEAYDALQDSIPKETID